MTTTAGAAVGVVAEVLHLPAARRARRHPRRRRRDPDPVRRRDRAQRRPGRRPGTWSPKPGLLDPERPTRLARVVTRPSCGSTSSRSSPTTSTRCGCRWSARRATAGCSTSACTTCAHWTTDVHRTVDDTPYGGGPGMVMRPEPWGAALDDDRADPTPAATPTLIVPTPAGAPFTQAECPAAGGAAVAGLRLRALRGHRLPGRRRRSAPRAGAARSRSATTCSAAARWPPSWWSRPWCACCPGVVGNAESLVEESHSPTACSKGPRTPSRRRWRELDVPPVLLSGDHGDDRRVAARPGPVAHRTAASRPARGAGRHRPRPRRTGPRSRRRFRPVAKIWQTRAVAHGVTSAR